MGFVSFYYKVDYYSWQVYIMKNRFSAERKGKISQTFKRINSVRV